MGLTLENKTQSIDITYSGFIRIQKRIACLIAKDFGEYYEKFVHESYEITEKDNIVVNEFMKKYNIPIEIMDFLFNDKQKLTRQGVKRLHELIMNDKEDFVIGYSGRADCSTYKEFREIVKNSYSKRMSIIWF